jgi:eukaryotic-like serine/threonine-protein kinase
MTKPPETPNAPDWASTPTSSPHTGDGGGAPQRGFGPYRFLQRLGEGGMGEVWLAEQVRPVRRQVAIKVIKAGMDSAQVIARFEAERQALALMDHPTIAKVLDGGTTTEGRPYFAMEYVRGDSIVTYCDRNRLTLNQRLELFIQVCDGVQHAHQKGIIHRDLKPSNVLVTISDNHPVPRIIDFGIAKAIAQPLTERSLFTELGMLIGTPEYMSPEQAEMTPIDVDTRSDVYSLGVLLYELMVGVLPIDRETLRNSPIDEVRRAIREKEPIRPSTRAIQIGAEAAGRRQSQPGKLASQIRGDLDWIALKALEKDRTRRYATANALAVDVRRHLNNEPVSAGPPGAAYRVRKFARRHRVGVGFAAMLAILLLSVASLMVVQSRRIAQERDRANQEAAAAKQVSDFLVGLFRVSDPSEARGATLTAREILSNGANQLDSSLRDQPAVQARLQKTIGEVYTGLGFYEDAARLLEKALDTQQRLLGEGDAETLITLNDLANAYWYQNKFQQAEPLYQQVVEQRQRLFGEEDAATLKAKYDLASLYLAVNRFEEAERLMTTTLNTQRRLLGEEHPDTIDSMGNLASLYYRMQRFSDALPINVRALELERRIRGDDHPLTLTALHNLATVYDQLGRFDEAEPLYLKSIEGRARVMGDEHPRTSVSRLRLAAMYAKQQRYQESESLALAAYHADVSALGPKHESTRTVIKQLIALYAASRQTAKQAEWQAKLASADAP